MLSNEIDFDPGATLINQGLTVFYMLKTIVQLKQGQSIAKIINIYTVTKEGYVHQIA
jgi:hypothetical protein